MQMVVVEVVLLALQELVLLELVAVAVLKQAEEVVVLHGFRVGIMVEVVL